MKKAIWRGPFLVRLWCANSAELADMEKHTAIIIQANFLRETHWRVLQDTQGIAELRLLTSGSQVRVLLGSPLLLVISEILFLYLKKIAISADVTEGAKQRKHPLIAAFDKFLLQRISLTL
jgi:hypothetical protein